MRGEYLDDPRCSVFFKAAENLDVPIYLHPTLPSPSILKPYADYAFPMAGPPFRFGAETALAFDALDMHQVV